MSTKFRFLFTKLCVVIIGMTVCACSFAPFTGPNNAKTVGEGRLRTITSVLPTLGQSIVYGLSDEMDVGALVEAQYGLVSSIWIKRNFINNQVGHSFAGLAGAFYTSDDVNSRGFYVGPAWSYVSQREWELYGVFKYNHIEWSGYGEIDDDSVLFDILDTFDGRSVEYFQVHGGGKFYFTPQFNLDIGMLFIGKSVISSPIPVVGFGWSFD